MSDERIEYEAVLDPERSVHRRVALAVLTGEQWALTLNELTISKSAAGGLIADDPDGTVAEPTEQADHAEPRPSALVEPDPGLEGPLEARSRAGRSARAMNRGVSTDEIEFEQPGRT